MGCDEMNEMCVKSGVLDFEFYYKQNIMMFFSYCWERREKKRVLCIYRSL